MHRFIESLNKRLQQLENSVQDLREELELKQFRPPIHVDTIHYSFDQLKVETLEGTLNIGLNPSDLESIENMEIDKNVNANASDPKELMELRISIGDKVRNYLNSDLKPLIERYGKELNMEVDNNYIDFIRNDIERQLRSRIDYYLERSKMNHLPIEQLKTQIEQQLILEIEKGVKTFLKKYPNKRKD